MEYIKNHKLTVFIIIVYIIVVAFAYFLYKLFIGSSGLPVYGDRLDGIEDVPISEEQIENIKEEIEKTDFVLKVTKPYLNGKVLKVVIYVSDKAGIDPSKALAAKVSEILTEEQKAFYDVEVFLTKYYNCTLEATGKIDEDGNFIDDVTVKFSSDLSKNEFALDYGISNSDKVSYNKEQEYTIDKDGEYLIYGFTKEKMGESKCSIKIVIKKSDVDAIEDTINSVTTQSFPLIGYKKYGTKDYVWTKK